MISSDWRSQIFEKKIGDPNLGQKKKTNPKLGFFLPFCPVWFIFLEPLCYDSLQQCLRPSRGKPHEKKFWDPNLGQTNQNQAWN